MSIDPALDSKDYTAPAITGGIVITKWKVSYQRVLKVLSSLNVNKSVNGVSPRFLRECAIEIAAAETSLISRIVREATYPTDWKVARVTPLHKKGAVSAPKNYRPVSALPNHSLVTERVLGPQLAEFCESITPSDQFGFVRKCGTADYGALVAMTFQDVLERRQEAVLISLDVKGAFDKVWHSSLQKKLQKGGLRRKALRLVISYLLERYLEVVAGGKRSSRKRISCGVPQGSIWSPNLWDVAVNDMSLQVLLKLFNYADDSALCVEFHGREGLLEVIKLINADLQSLLEWGVDINLTFESAKNTFMIISRSQRDYSDVLEATPIMMDGDAVERVSEMKLVGFTFDEKLSWATMISKLASKARSKLGALWRLRSVLDESNLGTMFKAFVRSVMEYGNLEYMSAAHTHLAKLDTVQRTAQRICGVSFEDLEVRRDAAVFGLICKLLDGAGRGDLELFTPQLLDRPEHRSSERLAKGLHLKTTVTAKSLQQYCRSFCGYAPTVMSKLPQDLLLSGQEDGWRSIMKHGQRFLCGKKLNYELYN
jgi:hypothetical protein